MSPKIGEKPKNFFYVNFFSGFRKGLVKKKFEFEAFLKLISTVKEHLFKKIAILTPYTFFIVLTCHPN